MTNEKDCKDGGTPESGGFDVEAFLRSLDLGPGLVVIASTNRVDDLDAALQRPGRFQDMPMPAFDFAAYPNERLPDVAERLLGGDNAYFTGFDPGGVIGHEVGHGLGDQVPLSGAMLEAKRLSVRIEAGRLFRQERPRIVEIIEKRLGGKLSDEELGLVLKQNREVPKGCEGWDYEVMTLEAREIFARLDVIFADELAKPAH